MGWKTSRRIAQGVFLLAFLALLLGSSYPLREVVPVELFLRLDPLLAVAAMLSGREWIVAFLPAILVVVLTLPLGRFFCGWVCPLGTTIDVFDRLAIRRKRRPAAQPVLAQGKYVTLVAGIVLAALGVQVVGWLDPICLATRSCGGVVLPFLAWIGGLVLTGLDLAGAPRVADAVSGALSGVGLPMDPTPTFGLQLVYGAILATVLGLSLIRKRFWCRSLCPLGGLLALLSRFRLVGPAFTDGCNACSRCEKACPTGALTPVDESGAAFENERASDPGECTQCMSCLPSCREGGIALARIRRRVARPEVDRRRVRPEVVPSRRAFLRTALASAAVTPLVILDSRRSATGDPRAIRPPGAQDERRFLDLCIRCGQCARGCPTGGLQPSGLEGGLEGLFSPRLVPRYVLGAGHCEFECNLCSQICPTGAIPPLGLAEKQATAMGIARFDENRCIPYVRGEDCVVCEEHCPTPDKAIRTDEVVVATGPRKGEVVKRPYVVEDLCIGCGTCESVCPLPGAAAVRVERRDSGEG